jgi:general secretion pathway protein J
MISPSRNYTDTREAGFTLLELLIAITLMAMMAVGLWSVFSISIQSWSRGTEAIDANQRHRSVFDLARKQIASVYPLFSPADRQQAGIPSLIFHGTDSSLVFVSLNSLRFHASPGLTLVSYEIAQNGDGRFALVAKEKPYTGQVLEQEISFEISDGIPIFDNLASCTFEYYDPGDSDNPPRWVGNWDGGALERLPTAVSLTLFSSERQGVSRDRHIVIPLRAQDSYTGAGGQNRFINIGRQRGGMRRGQGGPGGQGAGNVR